LKVKIVGGKSQKIKVNGFLLAFLETAGNRCRNAMIIDLSKSIIHSLAYESIRFDELLDKFYMLEAEICSKVTPALRDSLIETLSLEVLRAHYTCKT